MKPFCVFLTTAESYEGKEWLRINFEDRRHNLYCGEMARRPRTWACGTEISKLALNLDIDFDDFYYLLARVRGPRLPEQYNESCHPVWANWDKIVIGDREFSWPEAYGRDKHEELRIIYEDFWDSRLTAHS